MKNVKDWRGSLTSGVGPDSPGMYTEGKRPVISLDAGDICCRFFVQINDPN